mmetsp:Transcript_23014/g.34196  ORF Transcript_23014/g.34196 Transcript_23014/m.34196 type:complete len:186 (-) Transcript_23014:164-721(-)
MKTAASSSPPSPSAPPSKRQNTAEEKSEAVNSGLKVFFDQNQLALQKNIEEREAALKLGEQQLEEAKKAAPALFAKPGDQFTFHVTYCDFDAIVEYVGRNTTPPQKADFGGDHNNYQSPDIGWLIFRNVGEVNFRVYRDMVGAWPISKYSHYEGGKMKNDTLCIPPGMCGELKVWRGWGECDADY